MYTLGINAAFHDCSAAILSDGVAIAAAEEERFTKVKHGKRPFPFTVWQLPFHALYYDLLRTFAERTGVPVLVTTSSTRAVNRSCAAQRTRLNRFAPRRSMCWQSDRSCLRRRP